MIFCRHIAFAAIVMAAIVSSAQSVEARLIQLWTYEDLMEKSDLVVIGAAEKTTDFDGRLEIPQFADVMVPCVTPIRVGGVLKGSASDKNIELVHCQLEPDGRIVRNGPLLAHFETEGRTIRIEADENGPTDQLVRESAPSYLLFLKRREDGRYEPVAGVVDSELSVRKVTGGI